MTEKYLVLGKGFSTNELLPSFVNAYTITNSDYQAYVFLSTDLNRLVIQIWIRGNRLEIGGYNTFIFNIYPHTESQTDDEGDEKKYDYRPIESYGSVDGEACEMYDGFNLETAIKFLMVDLIENSNTNE